MPESNSSVNFSTAALASIPKLTVGNLYAWKTALKMYLKMTGLYEFIETKPERPEDQSDRARFDMREAAVLYAIHNTIDASNQSSRGVQHHPHSTQLGWRSSHRKHPLRTLQCLI